MNTVTSHKVSFNEFLDVEARIFSSCFVRTFDKTGNQVFSSKEINDVAQCTFNSLEKLYRTIGKK